MEHQQAKEMHAAEKYVLGELAEELREQFEEHYSDCPECALDVQTTMEFVAASKQIFSEELQPHGVKTEIGRKRSKWAGWLKPLIAVPALAVLVVMLGYEARQIRKSHQEAEMRDLSLVASADFGLRGGDREGGETVTVRVREGEAYGIHFDFLPSHTFASYIGEIEDAAGHVAMKLRIPGERVNKEVKFVVPPGRLAPGNYALVIYGDGAEPATKVAVAKFAFVVEVIH